MQIPQGRGNSCPLVIIESECCARHCHVAAHTRSDAPAAVEGLSWQVAKVHDAPAVAGGDSAGQAVVVSVAAIAVPTTQPVENRRRLTRPARADQYCLGHTLTLPVPPAKQLFPRRLSLDAHRTSERRRRLNCRCVARLSLQCYAVRPALSIRCSL